MKNLKKGFALLTTGALVLGMTAASCPAQVYDATGVLGAPVSVGGPPSLVAPGDTIANTDVNIDGTPAGLSVIDDAGTTSWTNDSDTYYLAFGYAEDKEPTPVPRTNEDGTPALDENGVQIVDLVGGVHNWYELKTGHIVGVVGGEISFHENTDCDYAFPEGDYSYTGADGTAVQISSGQIDAGVYAVDTQIELKADDPAQGQVFQGWAVYQADGNSLNAVSADSLTSDPAQFSGVEQEMLAGADGQSGQAQITVTVQGPGAPTVFIPVYGTQAPEPEPESSAPEGGQVTSDPAAQGGEQTTGDPAAAGGGQPVTDPSLSPAADPSALNPGSDQSGLDWSDETVLFTDGANQTRILTAKNAAIENLLPTLNQDGTSSVAVVPGTAVTVTASPAPDGMQFQRWNVISDGAAETSTLTDPVLTVTVGETDIMVEAVYTELPQAKILTAFNAAITNLPPTYNEDGSSSVAVQPGTTVTVSANAAPEGQQFQEWSIMSQDAEILSEITDPTMEIVVNQDNVSVQPRYADLPATWTLTANHALITDPAPVYNEDGTYSVAVEDGTVVSLSAAEAPQGQQFKQWNVASAGDAETTDLASPVLEVTVHASDVTVEAVYEDIPVPKAILKAVNAAIDNLEATDNGDGTYSVAVEDGTTVRLSAAEAPQGQQFKQWNVASAGDAETTDLASPVLEVTVHASDVTVEAVYEAIPQPETPKETEPAPQPETPKETEPAPQPETPEQTEAAPRKLNTFRLLNSSIENVQPAADEAGLPDGRTIQEKAEEIAQSTVTDAEGNTSLEAEAGTIISVTADAAPEGQQFKEWKVTSSGEVVTSSLTEPTLEVTLSTDDVTVEPVYVQAQADTPQILDSQVTVVQPAEGGAINLTELKAVDGTTNQYTYTLSPLPGYQIDSFTATMGGAVLESSTLSEDRTILMFTALNNVDPASITVTASLTLVTHTLTVRAGSGSGSYQQGEQVVITADPPKKGYQFSSWMLLQGNGSFASETRSQTKFTMASEDTIIRAQYELIPYMLSVKNGTGSGSFTKGTEVDIVPNFPPSGKEFDRWEKTSGKVKFDDINSYYATITMKANDTVVTALYKDGPDPNNNTITGLENGAEYLKSTTLTFTAAGAGMENGNPNPGDYRYRPASYQIGSVGGSWTASPYTTSMAINAAGDYTLTVTYAKDVYDGSSWNPDGTNVTKSITFHVVNALSVQTGDSSPLIPLAIAGGAALAVIILLIIVLKKRRK